MKAYTLSRSSRLYKFVFGRKEGTIDGFPEPRNDRISLGLFAGLLIFAAIMKPVAYALFLLLDALLRIMCFLIDGSYARGSLTGKFEIIQIQKWPSVLGRRLSPWLLLGVVVVPYRYWLVGAEDALPFLLLFVGTTIIFRSMKAEDKSPVEELANAVDPMVTEKLYLAYYREPKLFPTLHLVD